MTATAVMDDPEVLPFQLDLAARRVLFLRVGSAQRAAASFLDERVAQQGADGIWLPLQALIDADLPDTVTTPLCIFHIGHCGSTLLSRLLESWPQVGALREPLPLRTMARAQDTLERPDAEISAGDWSRLLEQLVRLWMRPLDITSCGLIKATSSCNGLIAPLLARFPQARVVLLDLALQPYLATVMKSHVALQDVAGAAPGRIAFLHACVPDPALRLHVLEWPEIAAMGWLAERLRFTELARRFEPSVLRVDFETLLDQPQSTLHGIAAHLGLGASGVGAAVASPHWHRYAKAPEHGYAAKDRQHDLALSKQRFGPDIQRGIAWVDRFLRRHPQLGDPAALLAG